MRALSAIAVVVAVSRLAAGQEAAQQPHFEVASVRPSAGDAGQDMYNPTRERFEADHITTKALVGYGYEVRQFQISGGPSWFATEQYDIVAKPQGEPTDARIKAMVRDLLEQRFGLKVHNEAKEAPVLALVVAKGGSKLRPAAGDALDVRGGSGHFSARAITMQLLAAQLADRVIERPVIDRTLLDGKFDIELEWAPDETPDLGPSIYTALQEQLGLRLDPQRSRVDVLVIDHIDRPGSN